MSRPKKTSARHASTGQPRRQAHPGGPLILAARRIRLVNRRVDAAIDENGSIRITYSKLANRQARIIRKTKIRMSCEAALATICLIDRLFTIANIDQAQVEEWAEQTQWEARNV